MTTKLIDWINQQLTERGWSARELARRAHLAHATINGVLASKSQPGPEFCRGVAHAFHEPPDHLFRLAGLLPSTIQEEDEENKQKLLDYWIYLNQDGRDTIISLAHALYEKRAEYETEHN